MFGDAVGVKKAAAKAPPKKPPKSAPSTVIAPLRKAKDDASDSDFDGF
jgi:hypothetical protein